MTDDQRKNYLNLIENTLPESFINKLKKKELKTERKNTNSKGNTLTLKENK